jgi:thioredoxin reductase (NADPH)
MAIGKNERMFPKLSFLEVERLNLFGRERSADAGEVLFDVGQTNVGVFVVLEGSIEILSAAGNDEAVFVVHEPGEFTGEVNLLSGRPSLVRGRAGKPSRLLETTCFGNSSRILKNCRAKAGP